MKLVEIPPLIVHIRRPGQYRLHSAQGRIPRSTLTPSSTAAGLLAGATVFMGTAPPTVHLLLDLSRRTFDRWSSRAPATPHAGPTRPTLRPGNVGPRQSIRDKSQQVSLRSTRLPLRLFPHRNSICRRWTSGDNDRRGRTIGCVRPGRDSLVTLLSLVDTVGGHPHPP
jgi:hypothetical protein